MRLLSCRLRQVRLHRDLELFFGEQLTVIGGPNETGKSTLVEALHKGLFLRATATGRGVEELRSRLHAGLPEVEISFTAAGEQWQLRKRFAGASGTCQLSSLGGSSLHGAEAEERLATLLGFDSPVEGRRIAQLPERWAHLWVRQGEAGGNPISGGPERYDQSRLVEQLQARGSSAVLESSRDRQVQELLQQRLAGFYTATGRVKAGSALAQAIQRSSEAQEALLQAQQRLSELEEAMEQWRQIGERLERIERQRRPALQREQALEQQSQLLRSSLEPLLQQHRERQQLEQQQSALQAAQQQQQREQEQLLKQQAELQTRTAHRQQQLQHWQQQQQHLQQQLELVQLLLDQAQLQAEQQQLEQHQHHLQSLQTEAEAVKAELSRLPPIEAEQVRSLRQAEQGLAQAQARCEAMAASVEVISTNQSIQLAGETLEAGDRRCISSPSELLVGTGVQLRLSPGGGDALPQAERDLQRWRQQCRSLCEQLGLQNSEQAETIERQRRSLESDLANLRKAAQAIPWSGLQERLAALTPRRQRLEQTLTIQATALAELLAERFGESPSEQAPSAQAAERDVLDAWLQQLRSQATAAGRSLELESSQKQQLEHQLHQIQSSLETAQRQLQQRAGSLQVLAERLQAASALPEPQLLDAQQQQLQGFEAELQRLRSTREAAGDSVSAALSRLEEEKDQLLNRRGQVEQLCSSLGASNPVAELEQCQAAWEEAEQERQQLALEGEALLLLQERLHQAQSQRANRYSEPLRAALAPYLADLATSHEAHLGFDPQQGFHNLQLQQGGEAFAFERLSGGMREQLAAALRLAMAEVLLPAYDHSLPLVFDDAFTNSDQQRLAGLKRMLQRGMRQGIQIVLLTCQPDDYSADLLDPAAGASGHETAQKNPPGQTGGRSIVAVQLG